MTATLGRRALMGAAALAAPLVVTNPAASAEAIRHQEPPYWPVHTSIVAGALIGGAIAGAVWDPTAPARNPEPRSWSLASGLYTLGLVLPIPALATGNNADSFAKGLFIYGETLAVGYLFDNLARAEPWSGGTHATLAYGGAVVASLLFAETSSAPEGMKALFWGTELALTSTSTVLRFRGSERDRQNWWTLPVESLLGAGIGLAGYLASACWASGKPPPGETAPEKNCLESLMTKPEGLGAFAGLLIGQTIGWNLPAFDPAAAPTLATLQVQPLVGEAPGISVTGQW